MQSDVLIVGAGAAGLMAAKTLAAAGKSITILEARDRIGGRIYPLPVEDFGYEAMGGAEFVHGEAPLTKQLVKEAGLTLGNVSEWWNVNDEKPSVLEKVPVYNATLKERLEGLRSDITVSEFFDQYFPGDEHADLRDFTFRRVEGYDAGDPLQASSFTLRDEILDDKSWVQMSLKGGYGALMRFIAADATHNGAEILLNKEVASIEWSHTGVKVDCKDNSSYTASKVIVTVPVPILSTIQFVPPLTEKIEAAQQIGFGSVIKILLRFKTKWWTGIRERQFEKLFFMFSNEIIPTWWTQYPEERPVLTGWVAGPKAVALSGKSSEELLERALTSLANIFKVDLAMLKNELVAYKVNDWVADPYAHGAYSYTTPTTTAAAAIVREPVADTLYFAGEALHEGYATATVEGALSSGQAAAEAVLQ